MRMRSASKPAGGLSCQTILVKLVNSQLFDGGDVERGRERNHQAGDVTEGKHYDRRVGKVLVKHPERTFHRKNPTNHDIGQDHQSDDVPGEQELSGNAASEREPSDDWRGSP